MASRLPRRYPLRVPVQDCASAFLSGQGIVYHCILTKEMAAAIVSAGLAIFGAYIGGRMARRAAVSAIEAQRAIDDQRRREDLRASQQVLAASLQAEMMALRDRYKTTFEPQFTAYQREHPAPGIVMSSEYFKVFDANSAELGILDAADARAIVSCYIALKGFADSLVQFSDDPRCAGSRTGGGMRVQDWDFIEWGVSQINTEAGQVMGDVEACVSRLNVYR